MSSCGIKGAPTHLETISFTGPLWKLYEHYNNHPNYDVAIIRGLRNVNDLASEVTQRQFVQDTAEVGLALERAERVGALDHDGQFALDLKVRVVHARPHPAARAKAPQRVLRVVRRPVPAGRAGRHQTDLPVRAVPS